MGGLLAAFAVWFSASLSGFVISEPAPYELFMVGLISIWLLCGLKIPREVIPLTVLLLLFNTGGVISMLTLPDWGDAQLYVAVGFFLGFTAIFFASVIAADHRRLEPIMAGYTAAATITGLLGIVGYFGLVPGAEIFTRFGRAMGAFQDPNVFAPFLILPTLYCLYGVLTRSLSGALLRVPLLVILSFALFLSFSRAGWGMFVISVAMLTMFVVIASPSNRFRLRVLLLAAAAIAAILVALLVAIQLDAVRDMLVDRAQLVQDYDRGQLGRFGRHWLGFMKAMEHPFGIGPLQFGKIFGEDPHNIWLKSLFAYSWLGFASYVILVFWTLCAGLKIVFRDRPWQPVLICALIAFIGHMIIGNVIDTDRWRHLYLVIGIIWGCIALEAKHQRKLGTQPTFA